MNKQTKIDAIEKRILDEHRKYFMVDSPIEWAKVAAIKIYSMFEEPFMLKETDEEAVRVQHFYNPETNTNQ